MKQHSKYLLFFCVILIATFLSNSCKKDVSLFMRKNKNLLENKSWGFKRFIVDGLHVYY
jgi:hypothetical protein